MTELERAYKQLDTALRKILTLEEAADGQKNGSFLLTDYIVISAVQGVDNEGDTCTGITYTLPPNQDIPWYRLMGLVEFTKNRLARMSAPDMPWGRN